MEDESSASAREQSQQQAARLLTQNDAAPLSLFDSESGMSREQLLEVLRHLPLDDKIVSRIDHSAKFSDDVFEYRFVLLPRNHPLLELSTDMRRRLFIEAEWRALGIRQTRGWEHFGYSPHEANALLFRRVIGTDPRSGRLTSCRQDQTAPVLQRLVELAESTQRYQLLHLNQRDFLRDGPTSFRPSQVDVAAPAESSRCSTADPDTRRMLIERVPVLGAQQRLMGIQPAQGLSPVSAGEGSRDVPAALARLLAAVLRVQQGAVPESETPTLDAKVLETDYFAGPHHQFDALPVAKELDETRFVNDVDFLYAKSFIPVLPLPMR